MNAFDVLFSLAILVLIGIYGIYWHEARRRPAGGKERDSRDDPSSPGPRAAPPP